MQFDWISIVLQTWKSIFPLVSLLLIDGWWWRQQQQPQQIFKNNELSPQIFFLAATQKHGVLYSAPS